MGDACFDDQGLAESGGIPHRSVFSIVEPLIVEPLM